jgi:hypothetical protein
MPKPPAKKVLKFIGAGVLLLAVPIACRVAWLQFGPPYVSAGNTTSQVDNLTRAYLAEKNFFWRTIIASPFLRNIVTFELYSLFCSPSDSKYADCFLELGKRDPDSQAGLNALLMADMAGMGSPEKSAEAFSLLISHHPDDPRLTSTLARHQYDLDTSEIQKLTAATHDHLVAAQARYVLGCSARRFHETAKARPEFEKALSAIKEVKVKSTANAAALDMTAERFKAPGSVLPEPLRSAIEGALYELDTLEVGCIAPEIEGINQNGSPMRLSDFKGKVIFLDFWGDW